MPRALRIHVPGGFYHVTLRGNHQQAIFAEEGDRRLLNTIVARALEKFRARLHAYCWMTNHLHFLLQVADEPLGNPMRNIASEFARAMQIKMNTTGHLFERRHHASLVAADAYLLELVRYIHLNPVRAGICEDPALFPWSSHHVYTCSRTEPWVSTDFVLGMFGSTRASALAAYRDFLNCQAAAWEPFDLAPIVAKQTSQSQQHSRRATAARNEVRDLEGLISEACLRFALEPDRLQSPLNDRYLAKVRGWIAFQSRKRQIASLAAVARRLDRDESTLRHAMRAYPEEME